MQGSGFYFCEEDSPEVGTRGAGQTNRGVGAEIQRRSVYVADENMVARGAGELIHFGLDHRIELLAPACGEEEFVRLAR